MKDWFASEGGGGDSAQLDVSIHKSQVQIIIEPRLLEKEPKNFTLRSRSISKSFLVSS